MDSTRRNQIRQCGVHSPALNDPDLFLRQPVQLIHQPVNLPIRRGDLRGEHALLVGCARGGATLVQREHLLDQRDPARVARLNGAKLVCRMRTRLIYYVR